MLKFSVLISVYQNEKTEYLKQALESILNQTLSPNEIVIVKDGRLPDDLNTVIDEYRQRKQDLFKILAFDQNRGLGLALRDGVLACSHEYIARMDSDDICEPTRFERQIQYLKENSHIALLGTWIKEFSLDLHTPDTATDLPCTHQDIVQFAQSRKVDTFVMGDDWKGKFDFLKEQCEVVYLPRTPEISTTQIKKDLKE